jgi:hypothetical protein
MAKLIYIFSSWHLHKRRKKRRRKRERKKNMRSERPMHTWVVEDERKTKAKES